MAQPNLVWNPGAGAPPMMAGGMAQGLPMGGGGAPQMSEPRGKSLTATVAAGSEQEIKVLLQQLGMWAKAMGLEQVEVMGVKPSEDGGFEAVLRAHNWNPFRAIKRNIQQTIIPYWSRFPSGSYMPFGKALKNIPSQLNYLVNPQAKYSEKTPSAAMVVRG